MNTTQLLCFGSWHWFSLWGIYATMLASYLSVIIAFLASCGCFLQAASASPADERVTTLGFISILTGEYSDVGKAMANGAELAVEDHNKANPTAPVRFILEDDGGDPKKGLSAFQKLRTIDLADIILPVSTFAIGAVRSIVNREKRITFIMGNEPYEPEDDYIYMLSPAAIPADREFGRYIASENPQGTILVVASENAAIIRFAEAVKEGIGARATLHQIPAGQTDLRSLVMQLRQKAPVAVVFVSLPRDSANLLRSMRDMRFLPKLYFDESLVNSLSDVKTILGDLSFLHSAEMLKLRTTTSIDFVARYKERFGDGPRMWSDCAYDAVSLALRLKEKRAEEAREWLKTNTYHGVSGKIDFDDAGLRKPEFDVVTLGSYLKESIGGLTSRTNEQLQN